PTIFVIFGITGDLAGRKLLPALLGLYAKKMLPSRFAVIGFSRRTFNREEFRELIRSRLNIQPGQFKEEDVKHFLDHISYEQGMFDNANAYEQLANKLKKIDAEWGQCSNKLFHLSVPPNLYQGILNRLAQSKLTIPCADQSGWTRILIEKPFGNNIEIARALDKLLGSLFKEKQIFRIDHYLAKEALQNIVAFRFTNSIFEPLWCRKYIEKIHIKLFEREGVEGRGAFYDSLGALKDVGQNHLLQMLSLVTMERPLSFVGDDIRYERARVLARLSKMKFRTIDKMFVKGQYRGYSSENGVSRDSQTETYIRVKTSIRNARWKNVPIYLESGKSMGETKTAIDIYFKNNPPAGGAADGGKSGQNILTFRIQPNEGIKIKFFVKVPGYEWKSEPRTLKFNYNDNPSLGLIVLNDYERLIHDAFAGDQTLFASTDEIMASWRFVTSILENWGKLPLVIYEKGAREVG
ncbi:MAG: glucose-6-phosphate dehydrogenase, partial [Patescibacteria group bacterium]